MLDIFVNFKKSPVLPCEEVTLPEELCPLDWPVNMLMLNFLD